MSHRYTTESLITVSIALQLFGNKPKYQAALYWPGNHAQWSVRKGPKLLHFFPDWDMSVCLEFHGVSSSRSINTNFMLVPNLRPDQIIKWFIFYILSLHGIKIAFSSSQDINDYPQYSVLVEGKMSDSVLCSIFCFSNVLGKRLTLGKSAVGLIFP